MTQERISKLRDKSIGIIQSKEQKKNHWGKKRITPQGSVGTIMEGLTFRHWRRRRGQERDTGKGKGLEKITPEIFPN